jgi:alpha-L-fucosidase
MGEDSSDDVEQLDWETETTGGNDPDRVEWFRDAGFGLFVHWGLSPLIGAGSSWPISGADAGFTDRYYDLAEAFDPKEFAPEQWARLARLAGMRYVIFTTKHSDGFCLFESEHTDFDVTNTPFEEDPASRVARAVRDEGLGVGWYYSPPDLRYQHETGEHNGIITDSTDPFTEWTAPFGPQDEGLLEYECGHIEELLTRYGDVDLLFIDGSPGPLKQHAWDVDPDVLITRGEMETPELIVDEIPADPPDPPWEACMTVQQRAWAHKPTYPGNEFHRFKTANALLDRLIETRAKGGNLLLNVGPKADGSFPEEAVKRLRNLAYWMAVNSDAIHGVRSWTVHREDGPAGDIWYTKERGASTVYAVFRTGWSEESPDPIDVQLDAVRPCQDTTVRLLGQPEMADWSDDGDSIQVTVAHRGQPLFEWYWPRYGWPVVLKMTDVASQNREGDE